MKKNVWLLGAAVAALTSCTQSEVLEVPESKQIRFEEFVEKNSRAELEETDMSGSTLTNYWVYGYYTPITGYVDDDANENTPKVPLFNFATKNSVFEGMAMTKTNGTWSYGDTDHWKPGNMYRFAAYSNNNQSLNEVIYDPATDKLTFSDYLTYDAADITSDPTKKPMDLIASIAGDRDAATGVNNVEFNFRHLLAKVTLYVTNASENADITLKDITIANLYKQADCECVFSGTDKPYPQNVTWSPKQGATVSDFSFGDLTVRHGVGAQTHGEVTFYVIPQSNNKTISFTLSETIENGDNKDYATEDLSYNLSTNTQVTSNIVKNNEWVPGYHYRYTITKGTTFNQIQFNVNVAGWNRNRDGLGDVTVDDNVPLQSSQGS